MANEPIQDSEAIYDEQINPLMAQIIALCKAHRIPFVACFQLTSGEEADGNPLLVSSSFAPDGSAPAILRADEAIKPKQTWHFTSMVIKKEG